MADQQTSDIHALVAALQSRIAEQELALRDVRAQLVRASSRRTAGGRRWVTILLVALLLVVSAAYGTATQAQQPLDDAKINAPTTSGDPVLVGRSATSSVMNNEVESTTLYHMSATQLASRQLRVANYSDFDLANAYFTPDAYRIAMLGTTSGKDTKTLMRIGVAGGANWPATLVNKAPEMQSPQGGSAAAVGVYGYGTGSAGYGVWGKSADSLGGLFEGKSAPIYLAPSNTNGPPKTGTHYMGELYVSADGNLYFCTEYGTPGKWTRLNVVQSFIPTVTK